MKLLKTLKLIFWFIIILILWALQELFGADIELIHSPYKDYFPIAISYGLTSNHANQCDPYCFNQQNNGSGFRFGPLMYMKIVNSMGDPGAVIALKTPDFGIRLWFFKLTTAGMMARITGYKTPDDKKEYQVIDTPMLDTKVGINTALFFIDSFELWLNYHYLPLVPGVDTNRWTLETGINF